jgi:vacuolar protein sorting-associated protein 13A/C
MESNSAAKSFGSGITGIVRMPVKGAIRKGLPGFIRGTFDGVAGLIAKPVSGTLDFFSKTSEGIK